MNFKDSGLKSTFDYLKNFGFKSQVEVVMPGTNAKMNEMQALMGIHVLKYLDEIIEKGRQIDALYRERLAAVPGIHLPLSLPEDIRYNYAYMPVEVYEEEFGMNRDELYEKLKQYNVFARRYFYPLICDFACYKSISIGASLEVAQKVSERILTLPTYYDLSLDDVNLICDILVQIQNDNKS